MNQRKALVAAVVAGLLGGCASYKSEDSAKASQPSTGAKKIYGECHGVNACKGKGECGGKGHECAGSNECKGKGWLKLTKEDCASKKGVFKPL
jgi:hypothetical protein